MKALLQHRAVQAALARTIAAYLRFVIRTTRWRFEGREHVEHARTRAVVAFWLRLNQPVIQLVNWLAYPLQFALLLPFAARRRGCQHQ